MNDYRELSDTELHAKLLELEQEHSDLDSAIDRIISTPPYNDLQLMRLKKKKLFLKDEIQRVRDMLTPDIIA